MKKIISVIIAIILIMLMVGCDQNSGDRIHIYAEGYDECFHLNGLEDGLEHSVDAYTEEEGKIHIEEGVYWIFEGEETCPFCDGKD